MLVEAQVLVEAQTAALADLVVALTKGTEVVVGAVSPVAVVTDGIGLFQLEEDYFQPPEGFQNSLSHEPLKYGHTHQ